MSSIFDENGVEKPDETPADPLPFLAETESETARKSGLAYSAGVVFFGSVAFMLFLGWGADLLLGSSPWGVVAGVVIGSIIGFTQFFRLTSRIFAKPAAESSPTPLSTRSDPDDSDRRL